MTIDREICSRQKLLTASAAVLAGVAVVPAVTFAQGAGPDAKLLRLDTLRKQALADANAAKDGQTWTARCDVVRDLEFKIHAIPALTFAGLAVKARLAYDVVPDPDQPLLEDVLASLLGDMLRFVGSTQLPCRCGG